MTIDVSQWRKALAMLNPVVNAKSTMPVLADVILKYEAERDVFTMTCSDGETWMTIDCTDKEGTPWMCIIEDDPKDRFCEVAIPFAALKEAVNLLPSAQMLQVAFAGNTMSVNYGIGEFQMTVLGSETFPQPIPVAGRDKDGALCRFTLEAAKLLPLMAAAVESTADDEFRAVMNGVCLDVFNDKVVVVATNGHELFDDVIETGVGGDWLEYATFPAYDQATQKPGSAKLLITKKARKALASAVGGGTITVTADTQRCEFCGEGVRIVTRLIEGNYPNYDAVIPRDSQYRVTVGRDALRLALRRVQLSANESTNMVHLCRDGKDFIVRAANDDNGRSGQERVEMHDTDAFLPDGFTIGLKISTAVGILDRIPTENVVLTLSAPNRPVLYRPEDVHSSRLILQMPMRVDE